MEVSIEIDVASTKTGKNKNKQEFRACHRCGEESIARS